MEKKVNETNQKKDDKIAEIEKLTAKIEQQVAQIRAEEKAQWEVNSAEMEKGFNGIKLALKAPMSTTPRPTRHTTPTMVSAPASLACWTLPSLTSPRA